ncbi:protein-disulfide reductase DsbD family protein [Crenothrix polyspora]|uniref:Protein-disulfide reductase n=1 Tax=Crenothrix polyspora TaxID=360316 RepID=A0A1R4H8Z1_9GAMM|nr:cytochrome c biogenesis protein CcdA [Crenothrix polyspora]SJM92693.1 Protein-disulfide reductase [Crenothrix polyspora]
MLKNNLPIILIFLLALLWIDMAFAQAPKVQVGVTAINANTWPTQYKITLTVPKDHHAYLDAGAENIYIPVAFDTDAKLASAGIAISKLEKPLGVKDDEVKANVLRDQGDFIVTLAQTGKVATAANTGVAIDYQLCNDVTHVCFRPQHTQAEIPLPVGGALAKTAINNTDEASLSFTDKLLSLFKDNKDNAIIMFGLMLMAGLLSVATPCVYPMLPITSMFIVNRANGNKDKEKQHAGAYMVGMVGTYVMLGLLAGMTGGAFNTFMQSATVNLVFAVFFAFFAIALLGFYELSFMQNEVHGLDQKTTRVNGLGGTWLMGTVAGLVISPCVGPIVFALLLQVADNIAAKSDAMALANQAMGFWDKFAVAGQGGLMMGGFGLGVALPFFIISVVKFKKLPKAGYWMNNVKYAFGFAILYFAYVYFAKGMGVLGVSPSVTASLAIGMVAIWIAVVHCHVLSLLPRDAMPNEKMHHYCGVVSLLIGGWLVVSGMGNLPFMAAVQAELLASNGAQVVAVAGGKGAVHEEAGITWYRNFAEAQKVAQKTGKPIFIDFYASWCANCTAFKEEAASNDSLNKALREKAIAVKLIDKEPDFEKFRSDPNHRPLKVGLPYFAILSPDGKVTWSGTDYKATEKMVSVLDSGAV